MKNVEMAIEILRKTNDGNGLNPGDASFWKKIIKL